MCVKEQVLSIRRLYKKPLINKYNSTRKTQLSLAFGLYFQLPRVTHGQTEQLSIIQIFRLHCIEDMRGHTKRRLSMQNIL